MYIHIYSRAYSPTSLGSMGGAFRESWWCNMPCQLMGFLGKPGKQEFNCQQVFEPDSFASLRWKMFVLRPENDHIGQDLNQIVQMCSTPPNHLVGQSTKLVGQNWKLVVEQSPHQLYLPIGNSTRVKRTYMRCCACMWYSRTVGR